MEKFYRDIATAADDIACTKSYERPRWGNAPIYPTNTRTTRSGGGGVEYEKKWRHLIAMGGSTDQTVADLTSNAICMSNPALQFGA